MRKTEVVFGVGLMLLGFSLNQLGFSGPVLGSICFVSGAALCFMGCKDWIYGEARPITFGNIDQPPIPLQPPDPDLALLDEAFKVLEFLEDYGAASHERLVSVSRDIQQHSLDPTTTRRSHGNYYVIHLDYWLQNERTMFRQLCKDRCFAMRHALAEKVPGAIDPNVDYEKAIDVGGIAAMLREMRQLISAYQEKLFDAGKISEEEFRNIR